MTVKLYSTRCPRCNVLAKKLEEKGIEFELLEDFDIHILTQRGFLSAPVLEVDEEFMNFSKANDWLKEH